MTQEATVIETGSDGFAVVEAVRHSACEGCERASSGCAACSLVGGQNKIRTRAKNAAGAQVGDRVRIEAPSGRTIGYAVLVFLFPLLAAGAGYGIASFLHASEGGAAAVSLAAFIASFAAIYAVSHCLLRGRCDIEITEVISDNGNSEEKH
ncbi:MAG: SoxR reducing system RseC family protein [Eubacteriales bacterium]|nr:SoxR reducing system RseC family protein [Eubacteriales bacterium]